MTADRRKISARNSANRRTLAGVSALCAAVCCVLATQHLSGQEAAKDLSVPVVISLTASRSSGAQPAMMYVEQTSQPTLPDGKLPQYQVSSRSEVDTPEQIEQSALRFLLALPAEPMLIETRITIDGESFRRKREQRVRETLQAALQTEVVSAPPPDKPGDPEAPLRAEKPGAGLDGTPGYQSASSHIEKLKRYIDSIGREPSLEEARWFFVNRLDGPTLLLLKDGFQAFRSNETPIFHILDRNRDGTISGTEIEQAVESFRDCDLNRNDVVEYLEINEAANDPRLRSADLVNVSPLLYLLPTESNADETYADLLSRYGDDQRQVTVIPTRFDANVDGLWSAEELEQLRTMPADLTLTVSFDSSAPGNSSLTVSGGSLESLTARQVKTGIVHSSIVLSLPDCELWLSGIQTQVGDQISVGAVQDGYPMLPVLDPNNDGRFTVRELRTLTAAIRQFDLNQDGQILKSELRPTIRLSFGLGSSVHQVLAGIREVHSAAPQSTAGPDWFTRMDRNKDNDVSRQEFPGTDEQFNLLDADGDKLISAEEALEADRQSSPAPTEPKPAGSGGTNPEPTPSDNNSQP